MNAITLSAPYLHDNWDREIAIEKEMLEAGRQRAQDRINKAREKGDLSNLRSHRSLLKEWIIPVAEWMEHWVTSARTKRGVKPVALPLLEDMDMKVASVIALRVILRTVGLNNRSLIGIASEIGSWIEHEQRADAWMDEEPESWAALTKSYQNRGSNAAHIKRSRVSVFNKHVGARIGWESWTQEQRYRVGFQLIDAVIQATGRFRLEQDMSRLAEARAKGPMKVPMILVADDDLLRWVGDAMDDELVHAPAYMPTVIPPKPWTSPRDGGYWTPFVKPPFLINFRADSEETRQRALDEWEAVDMPEVYEAINTIQETPWAVNLKVLEVAQRAWDLDLAIGGFPSKEAETIPDRPAEADIDDDLRKQWAKDASEVHAKNAKRISKYLSSRRTLLLAERMTHEREFYFPHMMDFRGRMYPIPSDLSPQGNDLHRGLLTFKEGKRLDENGVYWLKVHLANCYGFDKATYAERLDFVDANHEVFLGIAEDPWEYTDWMDADGGDATWQALAATFEFAGWLKDPENFVSHLPVRVDGTCNGLQHLSALIRDQECGASVNLTPGDRPRDIYQEVADILTDKLVEEMSEGGADAWMAARWLSLVDNRCTRSMTKRQVMIVPYGGTLHAYLDYTKEWLKKNDKIGLIRGTDEEYELIGYLSKHIWKAVGQKVEKAKEVMKWLQDTAKMVSSEGLHLKWTLPTGFHCRQFYSEFDTRCIDINIDGTRLQLREFKQNGKLDPKKASAGVAPNYVHSLDAAALMRTIIIAKDHGIRNFTTIHDSYGTLAADMNLLVAIIPEAFAQIHEDPQLERFLEDCKSLTVAKSWPKIPKYGKLNLNEIKESDYFFA